VASSPGRAGPASTWRWARTRPLPMGRGALSPDARYLAGLLEHRTPCSVLTKSPLLLRDLPLLAELAAEACSARRCRCDLDERAWRATEPHTPHPAARLEAVRELVRAGVPTSVLVAPLMPGSTTIRGWFARSWSRSRRGARNVTPVALHLRPGCAMCSSTGSSKRGRNWSETTQAVRRRRLPPGGRACAAWRAGSPSGPRAPGGARFEQPRLLAARRHGRQAHSQRSLF